MTDLIGEKMSAKHFHLEFRGERLGVRMPEDCFGPDRRGNQKCWSGTVNVSGTSGTILGSYTLAICIYTTPNGTGGYDANVSSNGTVTSNGWAADPHMPHSGLHLAIHWYNSENVMFGPQIDLPVITVPCGAKCLTIPSWNSVLDPGLYDLIVGTGIATSDDYWYKC